MTDQRLPPRVKDAEHANLRTQLAGVGGDLTRTDFEAHRHAFHTLPSAVGSLPADLRELVEYTEASVGSVVTVGRR